MSSDNDNAAPPLTPTQFSALLADFLNARDHALETRAADDHRAAEALRMRLLEAYERANKACR